MAKGEGAEKIIIISDCLEAVTTLRDNEVFWNRGAYTLDRIKVELCGFKSWNVFHLSREFNEAAHLLAKSVFSPTDPPEWVSTKVFQWLRDLGTILSC